MAECRMCGRPFLKDEFTGLFYCVDCDNILSLMPEGRTYMLSGGSGAGKSIFMYKVMDLYIRSSKPCVFVALDELSSQLRKSLGGLIGSLEESEKAALLTFVDCYSCMGGLTSQERYHLDSPADLNGLAFLVTKLTADLGKRAPVRVFIDSATAMFAHCDPDAILKFLYSMSARLKNSGGSLFFTVSSGAVTPEIQKRLEQLADGLVEFKMAESPSVANRYYRFSKVRGNMYFDTWLPFFVGDKGIKLAPPQEPQLLDRFYKTFELIKAS